MAENSATRKEKTINQDPMGAGKSNPIYGTPKAMAEYDKVFSFCTSYAQNDEYFRFDFKNKLELMGVDHLSLAQCEDYLEKAHLHLEETVKREKTWTPYKYRYPQRDPFRTAISDYIKKMYINRMALIRFGKRLEKRIKELKNPKRPIGRPKLPDHLKKQKPIKEKKPLGRPKIGPMEKKERVTFSLKKGTILQLEKNYGSVKDAIYHYIKSDVALIVFE